MVIIPINFYIIYRILNFFKQAISGIGDKTSIFQQNYKYIKNIPIIHC